MKYKLGDFVRFVDEKMEGFVTRIIDEQMIGVTGDDDFEIPVLASKVTFVHGYTAAGQQQENIAEQAAPSGEFKSKGVHIAVIQDPKANSVVHFYLVNETSFQLLASLTTEKQQHFKGEFAGLVAAQSVAKMYSAQLADLQLWPNFIFHIGYFTSQDAEPPRPLVVHEKFKAKDFSGTKKAIPLLTPPVTGWLIQLDDPGIAIDAQKLKESFFETKEEKTAVQKPGTEIDLHIEKLHHEHEFLFSTEILHIQLAHFHQMLDAAIVHQLPEITFIHGTGNGTLKREIHKLLGKHQKVSTFMDARKEKFGYGATRVVLK